MRTIIANWKMQLTVSEAEALARSLAESLPKSKRDSRVVVCPSFPALVPVKAALGESGILLGAQDVCEQEKGAWTGEVSARELVDIGTQAVIIGHSERRSAAKETDELVNAKVKRALAAKLLPVVCVGESREEREKGRRDTVVEKQVRAAFFGVDLPRKSEVVVAYEPTWAIGTGQAVDPEDAARSHFVIRETLRDLYSQETADRSCSIIYGGSVDRANIDAFFQRSIIEGVLVGGASLQAKEFLAIVDAAERAAQAPRQG